MSRYGFIISVVKNRLSGKLRGLVAEMARLLIGFILCMGVWSGLAEPFTQRIHLRDYCSDEQAVETLAGGFDGAVRLPFAFGLHFRQGEAYGYRRALFHVHSDAEGSVTLRFNRLFEPVGHTKREADQHVDVPGESRQVRAGWNWVDFPIYGRREMRFELEGDLACDLAVLTKSETFAPSNLDATMLMRETSRREPRDEYADRLFERNPLMPLADYVTAVAAHQGTTPQAPVALTDENGALLHEGRPFFPVMVFHSTFSPDEQMFNDLPVNLFSDRIPSGQSRYLQLLHNNALAGKDSSYEDFARRSREQQSDWVICHTGIMYLFDEPDSTYDPIALHRLHRLFKCFVPEIPTACCFCTFANPPETYRACDCVSFDHYPIGRREPWFSVEAIGWMVDRMRWAKPDKPVFATIQTFDQNDPGHYEGGNVNPTEGFPTERELNAMAWLAVAHGVRGLYFYNWKGLHNGHHETMPQLHPDGYAAFRRLLFRLHELERCLVGPDVRLPWRACGEAKVRVLMAADRSAAYLLAVNPKLHDVEETLASASDGFQNARFEKFFEFGVGLSVGANGVTLRMEELGSALFRISGAPLERLVRMSPDELERELSERAQMDSGVFTREAAEKGRRGQIRKLL